MGCENCKFYDEIVKRSKETDEAYFEPKCRKGVFLNIHKAAEMTNCSKKEEIKDEKPKEATKGS